jgi:hypothetical protein
VSTDLRDTLQQTGRTRDLLDTLAAVLGAGVPSHSQRAQAQVAPRELRSTPLPCFMQIALNNSGSHFSSIHVGFSQDEGEAPKPYRPDVNNIHIRPKRRRPTCALRNPNWASFKAQVAVSQAVPGDRRTNVGWSHGKRCGGHPPIRIAADNYHHPRLQPSRTATWTQSTPDCSIH